MGSENPLFEPYKEMLKEESPILLWGLDSQRLSYERDLDRAPLGGLRDRPPPPLPPPPDLDLERPPRGGLLLLLLPLAPPPAPNPPRS